MKTVTLDKARTFRRKVYGPGEVQVPDDFPSDVSKAVSTAKKTPAKKPASKES